MKVRRLRANSVELELTFDDAEFIGMELPRDDGFTKDWWDLVWKPMLDAREAREAGLL